MRFQRSRPAMTTPGSYSAGRTNRGYSPVALLIPALGLALAGAIVANGFRDQRATPPAPYEGPFRTEIVKKYDTISNYTLDCPVNGVVDQTYWNDQVIRLSGLPNSNINPGDELRVPEPCYQ